ncbi:MAG: esterase-like activity of phytase family protein, partial [Bacteroidaceae bacterium]
YSGIAHVRDNLYAVVDDKSDTEGFYLFHIDINPKNGKVTNAERLTFLHPRETSEFSPRADCEGIAYCNETNTLFISHEEFGTIVEYDLDGQPTGRQLIIPQNISRKQQRDNGGFEALAYDPHTNTLWTTTENLLKTDSLFTDQSGNKRQPLRLTRFSADSLSGNGQWTYLIDPPQLNDKAKYYAHGVSAMTVLPDGRLAVLERELSVPQNYLGSKCRIKIYVADTSQNPVRKKLLTTFTTHVNPLKTNYANYEGMCVGPMLDNGRPTLLLINDSQAGAGNTLFRLKDYIKIIIL